MLLRVWESIGAQVLLEMTDMKQLVDLSALQMLQFIRHLTHFLKDVKGAVVFGLHRQGGTETKCSNSVCLKFKVYYLSHVEVRSVCFRSANLLILA